MLSPDLVEFVNRDSEQEQTSWLERNPAVWNFVRSTTIRIIPMVIPEARRISAFDSTTGRHVHIVYRNGSQRHIIQIGQSGIAIESINTLIRDLEYIGGTCRIEKAYLIVYIPPGYYLSMSYRKKSHIMLARDLMR